ncbi:hypothetical protein [Bradyrhizobium sp.]|uniref:hypothetical protein n=1 Tax=Bradyrhizobium sp. TaxID=376 RepID=UPI002D596454|nr:hypothetical protein [Bradyrhizobium sp.]HZR77544.1 hypothetical protein [Bradyrhizobium sp.]
MAFPGVCAIAVVGSVIADTVRTANAMAAKVENIADEKRRMSALPLKNDRAPV